MEIMELMRQRHSVRQYTGMPIEDSKRAILNQMAEKCSAESGLRLCMVYDEPKCFNAMAAKIMSFKYCRDYLVIVGREDEAELEERAGYYGEQLVLKARELGLGSCWVAVTHGKPALELQPGETVIIVIALGYGTDEGRAHKNRSYALEANDTANCPEWFCRGVEAALLAPTAVNQQRFVFSYREGEAFLNPGKGKLTAMDGGIARCHFEAASGHPVNYEK